MSRKNRSRPAPREPGRLAHAGKIELRSYDVGALPLLNHVLDKMQLERFLSERLPPDDPRAELPTAQGLMVMVRNVLLSRQPIYGVGEWAARFAPDLFNLWEGEVALLGDDRLEQLNGTGPISDNRGAMWYEDGMPRTARLAPGGMLFHVLNRGVGRMRLFLKEADFEAFERVIENRQMKGR